MILKQTHQNKHCTLDLIWQFCQVCIKMNEILRLFITHLHTGVSSTMQYDIGTHVSCQLALWQGHMVATRYPINQVLNSSLDKAVVELLKKMQRWSYRLALGQTAWILLWHLKEMREVTRGHKPRLAYFLMGFWHRKTCSTSQINIRGGPRDFFLNISISVPLCSFNRCFLFLCLPFNSLS